MITTTPQFTKTARRMCAGAVLATAVLVTSCGTDRQDASSGGGGDRADRSTDLRGPLTPDDPLAVVIQFSSWSAGVPLPGDRPYLATMPGITVYGDGRVISGGGSEGPLPAPRAAYVSPPELEALLAGAHEAGLLDDQGPDTGEDIVTGQLFDFGGTTVTLRTGETTRTFSVYALGSEFLVDGLTPEQLATRETVAELQTQLHGVTADGASPYEAVELAVYVFPPRPPLGDVVTRWPLDRPLGEGGKPVDDGRCIHLTGDDAAVVLDAARDARSDGWSAPDGAWRVFFRPLLPHERGCP